MPTSALKLRIYFLLRSETWLPEHDLVSVHVAAVSHPTHLDDRSGPHPYDFNLTLITSLKALSPNIVTLGIGLQNMNSEGTQMFSP